MTAQINTSYPRKTTFHTVIGVVLSEQFAPELGAQRAEVPYLSGQWPNGDKFRIAITQKNFIIGRAFDSNLVVPPSVLYVSSRHIEIQKMPIGYAIVDLNSTNGTRLNQRPLLAMDAIRLNHGDSIQIGPPKNGLSFHFCIM